MGPAFYLSLTAYLITRRSLLFENSYRCVASTHSTICSAVEERHDLR